jgi:TIR domain
MGRDVFISYKHEDQEWANNICQALEARGVSCWVAFRDIPPGADWPGEIMDGLKNSRFFVLVLSSNSANEEQISREVRIAADQLKLPIFPIRIEDVQPPKKISYFLGDIQWLDAFNGHFDAAVGQLAQRIQGMRTGAADSSKPAQPSVAAPSLATMPEAIALPSPIPAIEKPAAGKTGLWIGVAAAAVIVIGLIVYFAIRTNPNPPPPHGIPKEGRDTAVAFLNDLRSGNYEGAWRELTPERRAKQDHDQWISTHQSDMQKDGSFTADLNNCTVGPRGLGYDCAFTLKYANGKTRSVTVNVLQKLDSGWGVASSSNRAPK